MMNCLQNDPRGAEILMDYCAGKLDAIRSVEWETHFHECAACRERVDAHRRVWEALDEWKPVEVSPDFDARLYGSIAAEAGRLWWRRILAKPLVPIVAAAAMLALVVARMPELRSTPQPRAVKTTAAPAGQRIDLQQLEQALDDMDMLTPVGQTSSSRL
jgi:anti-sigma factor RsiW